MRGYLRKTAEMAEVWGLLGTPQTTRVPGDARGVGGVMGRALREQPGCIASALCMASALCCGGAPWNAVT